MNIFSTRTAERLVSRYDVLSTINEKSVFPFNLTVYKDIREKSVFPLILYRISAPFNSISGRIPQIFRRVSKEAKGFQPITWLTAAAATFETLKKSAADIYSQVSNSSADEGNLTEKRENGFFYKTSFCWPSLKSARRKLLLKSQFSRSQNDCYANILGLMLPTKKSDVLLFTSQHITFI